MIDPSGTVGISTGANTVKLDPTSSGVIIQPALAWDGGPQAIVLTSNAGAVTGAAPLTLYAGAPGLKFKILSISAACAAFTTAGILWISDGTSTLWLAGFTAVGSTVLYSPGFVCFTSAVNAPVKLNTTGSATWHMSLVGYVAP
jgi:hypothetical protein